MNIGAFVLVQDFLQFGVEWGKCEKSRMAARRAFAATRSDGGTAGFLVRSQLLKQSQTSSAWFIDRCCSNPWAFQIGRNGIAADSFT